MNKKQLGEEVKTRQHLFLHLHITIIYGPGFCFPQIPHSYIETCNSKKDSFSHSTPVSRTGGHWVIAKAKMYIF